MTTKPAGKTTSPNPLERDKQRQNDIYTPGHDWRRGSVAMSELIGRVLDPVCARRGFASSQLIHAWPELIGEAFVDCTIPEKIQWTRDPTFGQVGTLIIRVDGPKAIYLQHEEHQILERLNRFFGFQAIHRLKIIQGPIQHDERARKPDLPQLTPHQERKLQSFVQEFEDPALQEAVTSMGRGVLRRVLSER